MLFEPLFTNARERPHDLAVVDDLGQYTYQQLAAMSAGLGMYLAGQTDKPHVGLLLPASAGFVASFYGTLLAGKTVVPINFLLSEREVAHVIADSGIDTVVTLPQLASRLASTPLKIVDLTQLPKTPAAIAPKFPSPHADDLAVLMYTSGTSGLPKGVMLTYDNLHSDVAACIEHADLQRRHTFLGIVPLFHAFGMTASMIAPITLGAPVVYMARFNGPGVINAIRKHHVSIIFGVPAMFGALLHVADASADDFKGFYAVLSGGEPMPTRMYQAFLKRFGLPLLEGFGMTETSPVLALNTPQANRPGSVGRPVPGVKIKVVDEDGNALPAGQTGELWFQGPMVTKGYYHLPDQTADVITADGFLKSGDLGHVDADGFLYITGRKKDLIISAGEKIAPREVEEVLLRHPGVAEAAVVGRKDESRGEVPVAFIVANPAHPAKPEDLRTFCRDQGLPAWKCPREVVVVEQLPRSPTGKVVKRALAEQLAARA